MICITNFCAVHSSWLRVTRGGAFPSLWGVLVLFTIHDTMVVLYCSIGCWFLYDIPFQRLAKRGLKIVDEEDCYFLCFFFFLSRRLDKLELVLCTLHNMMQRQQCPTVIHMQLLVINYPFVHNYKHDTYAHI